MANNNRYGWRPDLPDQRDLVYKVDRITALPKAVDLRANCPPVYDQGELGSCTANAIGGAVEYDFIRQKHAVYVPSRLFIYYNERAMEGTLNSDAGAQIRDGIKSVSKQGVCNETLWKYDIAKFTVKPPAKCYKLALKDIVLKYERLTSVNSYKNALAKGYPFVFGMTVYESFESDSVAKNGLVPMPSKKEKIMGGHAVMAVGYNDDTQCFIVRNSWGDSWGDKGYFYLPYKYFNGNLTDDFWVIYTVL